MPIVTDKPYTNNATSTTAPAKGTTPKRPAAHKLHAAAAKINSGLAATGSTIVAGVAAGHAKGKEWVTVVIDKTDSTSFLVKGDSVEGTIAIAKEAAKTLTRGTVKLITVPLAYLAGFTYGFWKEVYETLKDAYKTRKLSQQESKTLASKAEASPEAKVEDNVTVK